MNGEWEPSFRKILLRQTERYPLWEIEDLYKLIHQAAMGSEHAVSNSAAAQAWLDREIKSLAEGPEEPAIDPISPDGAIVRVNLRPYLAMKGDLRALLEAFVQTANEYPGSEDDLIRYWLLSERLAAEADLPFDVSDMREHIDQMQFLGYPAVHHSEQYSESYRPAYRVVATQFFTSNT
jgi:hypothetical protein